MTISQKKIGALILAAGNSSRMGFPKFLLKFDENKCFLEKIIEDYRAFGCQEIKVVLNKTGKQLFDKKNIKIIDTHDIIINPYDVSERFYSIQLGLNAFNEIPCVFLHHTDNPSAEKKVLSELAKYQEKADYIVPAFKKKGGHPILIGKKIIESIKKENREDVHFKKFLSCFAKLIVNVDSKHILTNINTLEEYQKLFTKK